MANLGSIRGLIGQLSRPATPPNPVLNRPAPPPKILAAELKAITRPGYVLDGRNPDGSWRMIRADLSKWLKVGFGPSPAPVRPINRPLPRPIDPVYWSPIHGSPPRPVPVGGPPPKRSGPWIGITDRVRRAGTVMHKRQTTPRARWRGLLGNGINAAQKKRADRFLGGA